jgi:polyisoprenoid-binding protein YceI
MKTKNIWAAALAVSSFLPALANATVFNVDTAHSNVGFEVKHLSLTTVRGNIPDVTGTIDLDEKDLTKSKAEFTAKVGSISTANAKRDAHLKSAEFFDAEKFPRPSSSASRSRRPAARTSTLSRATSPCTA